MNKLVNLLIVFYFNCVVNCKYYEKDVYLTTIKSNENALRFLNPDFANYLTLFDSLLDDKSSNLTTVCKTSLETLRQGLVNKDEWALKCKF